MTPEKRMIQAANMLKERADALLRYAGGVEVDETPMARLLATSSPMNTDEAQSLARFETQEGNTSLESFEDTVLIDQASETILFNSSVKEDIDVMEQLAWTMLAAVIKAREEKAMGWEDVEKEIKKKMANARSCWDVEQAFQEIKKNRKLLSSNAVRRLRTYGHNRLREEARRGEK